MHTSLLLDADATCRRPDVKYIDRELLLGRDDGPPSPRRDAWRRRRRRSAPFFQQFVDGTATNDEERADLPILGCRKARAASTGCAGSIPNRSTC